MENLNLTLPLKIAKIRALLCQCQVCKLWKPNWGRSWGRLIQQPKIGIDKCTYFGYTLFSMNTQVITIKVDSATKKEAQITADALGLSLSAVLKGFLKQFIRTKTVIFSARAEEIPNAHTLKILKIAEENYKKGNTSPAFTNIEDELKWLEEQGI